MRIQENAVEELQENLNDLCSPLDYWIKFMGLMMLIVVIPLTGTSLKISFLKWISQFPGISHSSEIKNEQKAESQATPTLSPAPESDPNIIANPISQSQPNNQKSSEGDFEKVIKWILKWEGGCSDDPLDFGGRTFKGITTERARMNGFKGDVCKMPDSQILEIYKKDYWNIYAHKYKYPMSLSVMNVTVNGGPGAAAEHLKDLPKSITDPYKQALFMADRMALRYRRIVAKTPSQYRFKHGWDNRNEDLKREIMNAKNGKIQK